MALSLLYKFPTNRLAALPLELKRRSRTTSMDDFNTDIESFRLDDHSSTSAAQGMRLPRCVTSNDIPVDHCEPEDVKLIAAHLPGTLPDEGIDLRAAVEEFESHLIRQALAKTGGNKNKAAQLLRLNRTTLVEMVKRKRLNVA